MNYFVSAFSGADNASLDIGRILLAITVISFIGLETFSVVVRHASFDAISFSAATVGLLTGGAAALLIKKGTEPPVTEAPK